MRLETIPFLSATHRAITISRCTESMCDAQTQAHQKTGTGLWGKKNVWCPMYGHKNTKNGATTEQKIWYQFRKIIRMLPCRDADFCKIEWHMHHARNAFESKGSGEVWAFVCRQHGAHTSICRCCTHFVHFASEFYIKWLETSGYWSGWHLACLAHFFAFNSIPFLLRFNLSDRCVCRYRYSWMQIHTHFTHRYRGVQQRREEANWNLLPRFSIRFLFLYLRCALFFFFFLFVAFRVLFHAHT